MNKKKKPAALSPEAAKILEQYRNAGKPQPATGEPGVPGSEGGGAPAKPTAPPLPKMQQRSGNRGK